MILILSTSKERTHQPAQHAMPQNNAAGRGGTFGRWARLPPLPAPQGVPLVHMLLAPNQSRGDKKQKKHQSSRAGKQPRKEPPCPTSRCHVHALVKGAMPVGNRRLQCPHQSSPQQLATGVNSQDELPKPPLEKQAESPTHAHASPACKHGQAPGNLRNPRPSMLTRRDPSPPGELSTTDLQRCRF